MGKEKEKMTTAKGTCKYCGQSRIVQVPDGPDLPEEVLNQVATDECDCEKAKFYRERQEKIERVEWIIGNLPPEHEQDIVGLLKKALPEIVDLKIRKISISVNSDVSYTMTRGKDGEVKIRRQEIIVSEDEAE